MGTGPVVLPRRRYKVHDWDSAGLLSHVFDWRRTVSQNTVTDHANNLLRDLSDYQEEETV